MNFQLQHAETQLASTSQNATYVDFPPTKNWQLPPICESNGRSEIQRSVPQCFHRITSQHSRLLAGDGQVEFIIRAARLGDLNHEFLDVFVLFRVVVEILKAIGATVSCGRI